MSEQQVTNGWPGLAEESTEICKVIGLNDAAQGEAEGLSEAGPEEAPAVSGQLVPGRGEDGG